MDQLEKLRVKNHVIKQRNGSFVTSSSKNFKEMVLVSMLKDE